MRAAAVLLLVMVVVALAHAQDAARWTRVDALLPPALRDSLPALLRLVGDFCFLPPVILSSDGGVEVVEHSAGGRRRYPVREVAPRLREHRPPRLAIYAAGWGNAPGDAAARAIVAALLTDHPLVLELDTSSELAVGYTEAAARVGQLAHVLAGAVLGAARAGITSDRIHVVGFSLGAHAAGAAARAVRRAGGGALGRLTALDPARPCFTRGAEAQRWRLTRTDADFVQVVHSSVGTLGLARPLGHVDVYLGTDKDANRGRGAAAMVRAHHSSWQVWARSARASALWAVKCAGISGEVDVHKGMCNGTLISVGYSCPPDTRGIFLVTDKG